MSTVAIPAASSTTTVIHPYISRTPGVQGGQPCIRGTRVTVRILVECWQDGMSPDEIAHSYSLPLAEIFDALGFYLDNRAEIEQIIIDNNTPPTPRPNLVIAKGAY